jgi:hypothetical protein
MGEDHGDTTTGDHGDTTRTRLRGETHKIETKENGLQVSPPGHTVQRGHTQRSGSLNVAVWWCPHRSFPHNVTVSWCPHFDPFECLHLRKSATSAVSPRIASNASMEHGRLSIALLLRKFTLGQPQMTLMFAD